MEDKRVFSHLESASVLTKKAVYETFSGLDLLIRGKVIHKRVFAMITPEISQAKR